MVHCSMSSLVSMAKGSDDPLIVIENAGITASKLMSNMAKDATECH